MPFKCEKVISALTDRIPVDGPKICDKVNAVYLFEIEEKKGGPVKKWTVDLKNKPGKKSAYFKDLVRRASTVRLTVPS